MKVLLLLLLPALCMGQYDFRRMIAPAAGFYAAGVSSGVADICSTPAKYNQSVFRKWNPVFRYGDYLGHKDESWVNKWRMSPDGLHIGKERFLGSSTILVGTTDIWHGSRSVMLTGFKVGVLTYRRPAAPKWWYYFADFAVLSAAYSAGWITADVVFKIK